MRWDDVWTVFAMFGIFSILVFLGVSWSSC